MTIDELLAVLRECPVIPILWARDPDTTLQQVDAVVDGGARVVEILMRTDAAPDAIAQTRARHDGLVVLAGTVLDEKRYGEAAASGAHCVVSPSFSAALVAAWRRHNLPLIPGAVTPSEVLAVRSAGCNLVKFYPSEPLHGRDILADYQHVFPDVAFVPTGGLSETLLPAYAALPNVAAVGGGWMLDGSSAASISAAMSRSLEAFATGALAPPERTSG